ncbi:UNVERIFIED_CONTAM: ATP-dependent DNA helicase Q-like SIM [Sesamum radiatum]|uniref:ATP-dependent DNA helicase Q-like SIM n=1 Tax=Sesamum radiatum TaxID=300843 RepID=A0AAW2RZA7_SESRA
MDGNDITSDQITAELVDMGFDISDITEAVKAVGPSLDNAIDFILNDTHRNNAGASNSVMRLTNNKVLGKRATSSLQPSGKLRQPNITEHLKLASGTKRSKTKGLCDAFVSTKNYLRGHVKGPEVTSAADTSSDLCAEAFMMPSSCKDEQIIGIDWENKVNSLIHKHFGFSSLKGFQKEVLAAWLEHQDCLVLAATGSGKSLCFQVPALLSGKVVIVISPLISLMHDQCLKLGKHGISACFLGSGQIDRSVEKKAMSGAYNIIYVCPETILRAWRHITKKLAVQAGMENWQTVSSMQIYQEYPHFYQVKEAKNRQSEHTRCYLIASEPKCLYNTLVRSFPSRDVSCASPNGLGLVSRSWSGPDPLLRQALNWEHILNLVRPVFSSKFDLGVLNGFILMPRCDVCINGPPEIQDLKVEATTLLQLIAANHGHDSCQDVSSDNDLKGRILKEKPNIRALVSRLREQNHTFSATDFIWWRGLARILEDRGFIRDVDDMVSTAGHDVDEITDCYNF